MEGIITGIGDKELGKNLIKPEYDAVINDFIIGKNTILEGLVLNGKNLSAGTCVLCGYRGIIDTPKELDTTAYVYGEFTLNSIYGGSGEDGFNIVTSTSALTTNVNPTEITSAGTYYLLLYISGVEQIDREHSYPKNSQYSVETDYVGDNAVISETATTPTELNELGEIETDLHLSQPNRVANTEYVHAQIERNIDYNNYEGNVYNNRNELLFSYKLYRKCKFVIGEITHNSSSLSVAIGTYDKIPVGFLPTQTVYFGCILYATLPTSCILSISNEGVIKVESSATSNFSTSKSTFGYQCQ